MKRFATLVAEKTAGKVEVKLYPSAQLGSASERHAVVGADALRQAVLLEKPGKHWFCLGNRG
jgi:hypothetical protein